MQFRWRMLMTFLPGQLSHVEEDTEHFWWTHSLSTEQFWSRQYHLPIFTDREKGSERLTSLLKVTQPGFKPRAPNPKQKQKHHFANKGLYSQSYGFPTVMYGCESWSIKKAECLRIDTFKLWCWRRLMRVPWTARRSNQSTSKEINLEYSLEGLMLKLKLQYFDYLMRRANSLGKNPDAEKDWEQEDKGVDRGWDAWMASLTQWMNVSKLWEIVKDREVWCAAVRGVAKSRTRLSALTTTTLLID